MSRQGNGTALVGALKVGELARRTGLTVRTLHHYDAIGLLRPSARTASGHRLYTPDDVVRLQQVLSLREIGFSLEEIREYLATRKTSPQEIIRLQVERLRERIAAATRLVDRLESLAQRLDGSSATVDELLTAIEEMTAMERLYTDEQMERFREAAEKVGREEIAAIEKEWAALLAEVRANRHLSPTDPRAQELAERWDALTARTMRGFDPELKGAIAENYRRGAFEGDTRAPQADDFEFIERVRAARGSTGGSA